MTSVRFRAPKQTIHNLLSLGLTKRGIAFALRVCSRTISRWMEGKHLVKKKRGRPEKLDNMTKQRILDMLVSCPFQTQSDLLRGIMDRVHVHQSTVSRFLKKVRWTRKKVSHKTARRDEEKALQWLQSIKGASLDDFLALDETSFVTTQTQCSYGYAPKGQACRFEREVRLQRERITLLICIQPSSGSVVHHKIVKGSMTAVLFQEFLATIPSFCKGKRLLLDNARIHHATQACRLADLPTIQETADLSLSYLPPYSPQYNPAELDLRKECVLSLGKK